MHTGPGRVGYDYVRPPVGGYKPGSQHILHVSGYESGVVQAIDTGVDTGVFDGLRHIFDTHHVSCATGHKTCYGTGARVEVVHQGLTVLRQRRRLVKTRHAAHMGI